MCGGGGSSSGGESNIARGGRGSNIAEKKKSKTEMAFGQGLSKFVGSMLGGAVGGPAGAFAGSKFLGNIAKGSTTNEINLSTGRSTAGSGAGPSGDDNSGSGGGLLLAQQEAAAKTAASEKTAATAAAKEAQRKKSAATTKARTILAGKKIAEDKLKTKLGQ